MSTASGNARRAGSRFFASSKRRHRVEKRYRRLRAELLEDRRVLSLDLPSVELFGVSPALFVENQGQWFDASVRFLHQGNGASVAVTDTGPVFELVRHEPAELQSADPTLPDADGSAAGSVPRRYSTTSSANGRVGAPRCPVARW